MMEVRMMNSPVAIRITFLNLPVQIKLNAICLALAERSGSLDIYQSPDKSRTYELAVVLQGSSSIESAVSSILEVIDEFKQRGDCRCRILVDSIRAEEFVIHGEKIEMQSLVEPITNAICAASEAETPERLKSRVQMYTCYWTRWGKRTEKSDENPNEGSFE
jgi:hypothetical protein